MTSINNVGIVLKLMGNLDDAERYSREALEGNRRVLGNDDVGTLFSINNMGDLLRELGRLEEAEELGAEAVRGARRSLPEGHWNTGVFLTGHAESLAKLKRYAEAETALLEAYGILEPALGPEHEHTIRVVQSLGGCYTAWHEAEPVAGYDAKAAAWRAKLEEWSDDAPDE